MNDSADSGWSENELKLINVVDVFLHKPTIMKKVEAHLLQLKEALAADLAAHPRPYPQGTDLVKGQIARGENHKGFPFISLHIPQNFSKTEFFTYRTLFWWGHYLAFSLLLKGPGLPEYLKCLLRNRQQSGDEETFVAKNTSPWEWEWTEENYVQVNQASEEEIQAVINNIGYIKLVRFFPLAEPSFSSLDWASAGVHTYGELIALVMD